MPKLRIILADDHTILREGLKALIDAQSDMIVIGEAPDGASAVSATVELLPDVVVMDISMPQLGGSAATKQIKQHCPTVRVLALTAHEDSEYVQLLLSAGASGYVLKRAAAADLVGAIRSVAAGRLYVDATMLTESIALNQPAQSCPATGSNELSEREADVIRMVALGYSMKRMAATLALSPRTVETYKKRAMAKLGLQNRADIVRFALQQTWLKDA
jgi:DNA-binding NarL/FixJ family response regulator